MSLEKVQSAIIPKLGKAELLFFDTALLITVIYQLTKFLVDISYGFRVTFRTNSKSKNK
jgi:hypothetical protein